MFCEESVLEFKFAVGMSRKNGNQEQDQEFGEVAAKVLAI